VIRFLVVILEALGGEKEKEEDPHPGPLPQAGEGVRPDAAVTPSPACGRRLG
jgi:hypothetical protein